MAGEMGSQPDHNMGVFLHITSSLCSHLASSDTFFDHFMFKVPKVCFTSYFTCLTSLSLLGLTVCEDSCFFLFTAVSLALRVVCLRGIT